MLSAVPVGNLEWRSVVLGDRGVYGVWREDGINRMPATQAEADQR